MFITLHQFMDKLFGILINSYFNNSRCIILLTDNYTSFDYKGNIPIINLRTRTDNLTFEKETIFQYHGCQDIIIAHERPIKQFVELENLIKLNSERFNVRRYIILSNNNSMDIFLTVQMKYVADVILIIRNKLRFADIYTHRYVGPNNSNDVFLLDRWFYGNSSFLFDNFLFPDKITNQFGRELHFATFTYEPYTIVDSTNDVWDGMEMSLVKEFGKRHNMTLVLHEIEKDNWGKIHQNWSGDGLLGCLAEDNVDIAFAALYSLDEYHYFLDFSKPFTRSGVTCLVPAPKLAAGWMIPLYSFSNEMWIAVLVTYLLSSFILFVITYVSIYIYKKIKKPHDFLNQTLFVSKYAASAIFNIYKTFVLQPLNTPDESKSLRYFLSVIFIFSLLLTSSYSGGLASIMTIPRNVSISSNLLDSFTKYSPRHQIIASAGGEAKVFVRRMFNTGEILRYYELDSHSSARRSLMSRTDNYQKLIQKFVVHTYENLEVISKTGTHGFSLERLSYGHFAVGTYLQKEVITNYRILREDVYWEYCIFMLRKSSILLPKLNELLLHVFEAGLVAQWESQVVSKYMDMPVQRGIVYYSQHLNEHIVTTLRWIHVEGTFGILFIGYSVAVLFFIAELIFHRVFDNNNI